MGFDIGICDDCGVYRPEPYGLWICRDGLNRDETNGKQCGRWTCIRCTFRWQDSDWQGINFYCRIHRRSRLTVAACPPPGCPVPEETLQ